MIKPKVEIKLTTDFEESVLVPKKIKDIPNFLGYDEFLSNLFDGKKFKSKLLYRGSRDGFDAAKFHQLCDNKVPTITLIKSVKGLIFGGYSSIDWASNVNNYKSAPGSFLFSLNKKTKHEIYQNQHHAIYLHNDYGPRIGGGHDIYISLQIVIKIQIVFVI